MTSTLRGEGFGPKWTCIDGEGLRSVWTSTLKSQQSYYYYNDFLITISLSLENTS